jgi:hypothetical protein
LTNRQATTAKGRFPLLRGVIVVLVLTWGVALLSLAVLKAAGAGRLGEVSFSILLTWVFLFLPHQQIFPTPIGNSTAFGLALSQWTLAGAVVGHLTRSMGHRRMLVVAIIATAAMSVAMHILIRIAGYEVIVEGP